MIADVAIPHISTPLRIEGESKIPKASGKVRRLWLEPSEPPAYPEVIKQILSADLIIVGPGSLYTSILPNLLVPEIVQAIDASRAVKIYVCNVANQPGETDGYNCQDYLDAIQTHVDHDLFDIVLCNRTPAGHLQSGAIPNLELVQVDENILAREPIYLADLVDDLNFHRHDSQKLGSVIIDLWQERTGPLVE